MSAEQNCPWFWCNSNAENDVNSSPTCISVFLLYKVWALCLDILFYLKTINGLHFCLRHWQWKKYSLITSSITKDRLRVRTHTRSQAGYRNTIQVPPLRGGSHRPEPSGAWAGNWSQEAAESNQGSTACNTSNRHISSDSLILIFWSLAWG